MRVYTLNPDGTVKQATNRTTSFSQRLNEKYPTPEMDKKEDKELNEYDEHKLFN